MKETVYILLGSNLGDTERNLSTAILELKTIVGVAVLDCSGVYRSEAQEMEGDNPDFFNQVVKIACALSPFQLLAELESVEQKLGRTDKGEIHSRTLDLDILLFGNQVIHTKRLTIPHQRLHLRPFALIPLLDIAPDIVHPRTGKPIGDYVDSDDYDSVNRMNHYAASNN